MSSFLSRHSRRLYQLRRAFSQIEVSPQEAVNSKKAPCPPCELPPATLGRLGYLFSCSGNVVFWAGGKQLAISVISVQRWLPAEFWDNFGGGVTVLSGKGGTRPAYCWRLCGQKAIKAAKFLAPFACRKRKLLEILGSTKCTSCVRLREEKEKHFAMLQMKNTLKNNFVENARVIHWKDLVQLLDSRGSFRLVPGAGSIRICINHPNRELLLSVNPFLPAVSGPGVFLPRVYRNVFFKKNYVSYAWDLQGKILPLLILREALKQGLQVQRERAEQILLTFERKSLSRSFPIRSNQNRNKTLTEAELRITELMAFLRRTKKKTSGVQCSTMSSLLTMAGIEREKSKKRTEILRRREELKKVLRD